MMRKRAMPIHLLEKLSWLFDIPPSKPTGPSSCATFSPVSASNGDPWQSTTTPSARPTKKTIILTGDFVHGEETDFFALIEYLRRDGFDVRLCIFDPLTQKNIFPAFKGAADLSQLSQLEKCNKKTDYDTLAEQGITRDQQVRLDGEKFAQLVDCLEKTHALPHSNAIVTATTIRFHHYPEKITDVESFSAHLRAAPDTEEAAKLFIAHAEAIHREIEYRIKFAKCFAAYPEGIFIEKYGREAMQWRLHPLLEHSPLATKKLIETYGDDIEDGYALAIHLALYPEKADACITAHGHKIENSGHLITCLRGLPLLLAERLIQMHHDKIKDAGELLLCSEACPAASKILLHFYGYEIRDGNEVAVHLRAYPEKTDALLKAYAGKIQNADQLMACIYASPSHAEMLLKNNIKKMGKSYPYSLNTYLKKWPAGKAILLEKWPHVFSTNDLQDFAEDRSLFERYFPEVLDTVYKMPFAPAIAPAEAVENAHCLYVGRITERTTEEVLRCIEHHSLCNISLIEIADCAEDQAENVWKILNTFPKDMTRHVFLPKNIYLKSSTLPKGLHYHCLHYQKYTVQKSEELDQDQVIAAPSNKLHVALKEISEDFGRENDGRDKSGFTMAPTGEILNAESHQKMPRVRVGILDLNVENFTWSHRQPTVFLPVEEVSLLSRKAFKRLCEEKSIAQEGCYAKFKQDIVPGKKTRLPSIDAAELFLAMHTRPFSAGGAVTIEKGKEDDFYYATAIQACALEYIVEAKTQEELEALYADMPSNHPIKRIIEFFRRNEKYIDIAETNYFIPALEGSARDWWKKLYTDCLGVCRHRVGSTYAEIFYELLQQHPEWAEKIRISDIAGNHVRLEICDDKKNWLQVDLGGGAGNSTYLDAEKDALDMESDEDVAGPPEKMTNKEQTILKKWRDKVAPKHIKTADDFLSHTLDQSRQTKILCATSDVHALDTQANFLLENAVRHARPVFYIDDPSKIDICSAEDDNARVFLNAAGQPELVSRSVLQEFLVQAKASQIPPLLLINWQKFSPQERLKLNALLDKKRMLCGLPVPENVQIVGVCVSMPEDPSFLSRHHARLDTANLYLPPVTSQANAYATQKITIDLQGFSNWEEALFGVIVQTARNKNNMAWEKSAFVHALEDASTSGSIEIVNASNPTALSYCLNQARALGKFSYRGHAIPFPRHLHIQCNAAKFDFSACNPVAVKTPHMQGAVPADMHIVSTHRFDFLLVDKKISDTTLPSPSMFAAQEKGVYEKMPGLIEAHAGETLSLYVTSNLTDAQWYCLCAEAKKQHVRLELSLAPSVILPAQLQQIPCIPLEDKKEDDADKAQHAMYVSDQLDRLEHRIKSLPEYEDKEKPLVLHVEDYAFGDLLFELTYKKVDGRFGDFKALKSEVLEELMRGRDVVLRGEFSDALLSELQPFLLGQPVRLPTGESIPLKGKLICLIEPSATLDLNWLSVPLLCDPAQLPDVTYLGMQRGEEIYIDAEDCKEEQDSGASLHDSEAQAAAFIENRKRILLKTLQTNSIVQMISDSGAGKSRLMSQIKMDGMCAVYNEFSSLEAWAKDARAQDKILFLDESNITDLHLTLFSPLKPGGSREMVYKGKKYQLDAHHKVVCACNGKHYGGGRAEQKLFQDGSIPKIYFSDFSDAYIYEEIIKPILLLEQLGDAARSEEYKELGQFLIQRYKQIKKETGALTVRELQEFVLQSCQQMRQAVYTSAPVAAEEKEDSFLVTPGNEPILASLQTFIQIRKKAQEKGMDLNGMGLNGFLLEGKPATGKSEMIGHALCQSGYRMVHNLAEASAAEHPFLCYKIDTYLSLKEKERMIIHAFENGHAIWIDELNGCIHEGLEKILNAVLTGEHPETKGKPKKSGCMAFFTANSAGLEGRSFIGQAIRHRCTQFATQNYTQADLDIILAEKLPHYTEVERQAVAEEFLFLQRHGYDLRTCLDEIRWNDLEREAALQHLSVAAAALHSSSGFVRQLDRVPEFVDRSVVGYAA